MYFAIQVSTASNGKVLNQINWHAHVNAVGDVDIFGSNRAITNPNFTDETLWTWLGRTYFGGAGGGVADCTVKTQSFNPLSYGES